MPVPQAATLLVRWPVAKALLALVSAKLPGDVLVEPGYPGAKMKPKAVWIDELDGPVEMPVFVGGRKERGETFTIPLEFRVAGARDLTAAMDDLHNLMTPIDDALADDPSLGLFDGLLDAVVSNVRMTCGGTTSGAMAYGELTITCNSRLE